MVKLIVGVKGTGKTKTLIEMVNKAAEESKGSVICIERGNELNFDITHKARLISAEDYGITDASALYGFVAGITASDHDITDIFVDAALKICQGDLEAFKNAVVAIDKLSVAHSYNCVMTVSAKTEDCYKDLHDYM